MHFSVLLIHEWSEKEVMSKRRYDADESEGAEMEFSIEYTKEDVEKEYKSFIKKNPDEKEVFPTVDDYMEATYSCLDKDEHGNWGKIYNLHPNFPAYMLRGGCSMCFYKSEKEYKALLKNALNLKNKEVKKKYENNVAEYVKISEMPVKQACAYLGIGGQDSLQISDEISAQDIIDWARAVTSSWVEEKEYDAINSLYNTMIIETDEETTVYHDKDDNINENVFREKYEEYLKESKESSREFYVTVLDLHT
jgi:hypothetical protein